MFRINSHLLFLVLIFKTLAPWHRCLCLHRPSENLQHYRSGYRCSYAPVLVPYRWRCTTYPSAGSAWSKNNLLDWLPNRLNDYVKAALQNSILMGRTIGVAAYNTNKHWAGVSPVQGYVLLVWTLICVNGALIPAMKTLILMCQWAKTAMHMTALWCVWKRSARACASLSSVCTTCLPGHSKPIIHWQHRHQKSARCRILKPWSITSPSFLGPVYASTGIIPNDWSYQGCQQLLPDQWWQHHELPHAIRTPSFPHLQQIPSVIRGQLVSDLIVYLGSIDFVMSDVDR